MRKLTDRQGLALCAGVTVLAFAFGPTIQATPEPPAITGSTTTAQYSEREWKAFCGYWAMGAKADPRDEAVCQFRADKARAEREEDARRDMERARREPLYHSSR